MLLLLPVILAWRGLRLLFGKLPHVTIQLEFPTEEGRPVPGVARYDVEPDGPFPRAVVKR